MCDIEYADKLITDLGVIGKIGPGTKINTKNKYLKLDDTTWWQGATRWYRGDSRDTTYDKIHLAISNSYRFIKLALEDISKNPYETSSIYMENTPGEFLIILSDILRKAKTGIENLRDTYIHDSTISSRFEKDIISIRNQLSVINKTVGSSERSNSLTGDF